MRGSNRRWLLRSPTALPVLCSMSRAMPAVVVLMPILRPAPLSEMAAMTMTPLAQPTIALRPMMPLSMTSPEQPVMMIGSSIAFL